MSTTSEIAAARAADRELPPAAIGAVRALSLVELAQGLARLQPPPAYRLSLDSGIEYKNVRRAFDQPLAARLDTWRRLLRSLGIRPIAVAAVPGDPVAGIATVPARSCTLAMTVDADGLRSLRQYRAWSRRELARRAGVSVDAVGALERGGGMVESLVRVCAALGLELLLALPPGTASLCELWEQRAHRCLESPAQYPLRGAPRARRG